MSAPAPPTVSPAARPPPVFIGVSGKRCAGKDYFATRFASYMAEAHNKVSKIIMIASNLKLDFCRQRNHDFQRLMNDRAYKDSVRAELTAFSREVTARDPDYWCRLWRQAIAAVTNEGIDILICTDIRFKGAIPVVRGLVPKAYFVRINTSNAVRERFGWKYEPALDDNVSETDCDAYTGWDYAFENLGTQEPIEAACVALLAFVL
eukprot:gnl/Spiro4/17448_TR9282_c0_g1_i1.p1 gnl/Spiro4/17448_TR9282_c0_g1~~gnl/Spiro4/17448_TR9282_c0_g1_i1.p1  ORF type:complete len:217 (+),score=48.97 gnl/Spiro4/17448_TR9282_c0_g1_i1:36-653(+)